MGRNVGILLVNELGRLGWVEMWVFFSLMNWAG